jgi:hypothetical protein
MVVNLTYSLPYPHKRDEVTKNPRKWCASYRARPQRSIIVDSDQLSDHHHALIPLDDGQTSCLPSDLSSHDMESTETVDFVQEAPHRVSGRDILPFRAAFRPTSTATVSDATESVHHIYTDSSVTNVVSYSLDDTVDSTMATSPLSTPTDFGGDSYAEMWHCFLAQDDLDNNGAQLSGGSTSSETFALVTPRPATSPAGEQFMLLSPPPCKQSQRPIHDEGWKIPSSILLPEL